MERPLRWTHPRRQRRGTLRWRRQLEATKEIFLVAICGYLSVAVVGMCVYMYHHVLLDST